MIHTQKIFKQSPTVKRYAYMLAIVWTLLLAGFGVWGVHQKLHHTDELIRNEARTLFLKDQAFRYWASAHGGIYVPPDERTPPNPHLSHIPDRDIETRDGKKLTLMNPSYMVRQLMEEFEELYGVRGHITSLKPLRPENGPDPWERKALKSFELGKTEANEFTEIDGKPYLRLMRPMLVKQSCLKCHAQQGYQEGDVRGGVGISVPTTPFLNEAHIEIIKGSTGLTLIWLLGLVMMAFGTHRIWQYAVGRDRAEEALKNNETLYRNLTETTAVIPWELDLETIKFTYVGPQSEDILGYPSENWTDFAFWKNIIHPDDRANAVSFYQPGIGESRANEFEYRIIHAKGNTVWLRDIVTVEQNKGNPVALRGYLQDITTSKTRELAIDNILKAVSSGTGQTFFNEILIQLEKTLDCNFAFIGELTGHDNRTVRTQSFLAAGEIIDNLEYHLDNTPCDNVVTSGFSIYPSNICEAFPDNKMLDDMEVDGYAGVSLRNKHNKTIGLMVILWKQPIRDIEFSTSVLQMFAERTSAELERQQSESEKKRLRNYLANVINSMPSVLVGVTPDGKVTQWNIEAQRLTGIPPDTAVGQPLEQAFPRLAAEMKQVREAMLTREARSEPRQARKEKGETLYEDITVYPLITNGIEGAVIRVDDVTERVRIEEMMVQSEKMLSVGGLAAGMAHEINNPLGGMMQTANVMSNRLTNLDLPINQRAAEKAGTTIEAIRTFMDLR